MVVPRIRVILMEFLVLVSKSTMIGAVLRAALETLLVSTFVGFADFLME